MMRTTLALTALILGTPALAEEAPALDTAAMQSCLDAAAEPVGKYACIGMASDACQQVPGHDSTAGMTECLGAERGWWDARLNETYDKLMASHRDTDKATEGVAGAQPQAPALRAAERAWLAYRDAECAYQQGFFAGGSGAGPAVLLCEMDLTGRRAIDLRASLLAAETR